MATNDVARIFGLLEGHDKSFDEIKEDLKKIKNNDNSKLRKIAEAEIKIENLENTEKELKKANDKLIENMSKIQKSFYDYRDNEKSWRIVMVSSIVLVLFDLATRFFIK